MDYFHVEPASSHEKNVYSTRLPAELYDHIIKGELRSLNIRFEGKNAVSANHLLGLCVFHEVLKVYPN